MALMPLMALLRVLTLTCNMRFVTYIHIYIRLAPMLGKCSPPHVSIVTAVTAVTAVPVTVAAVL